MSPCRLEIDLTKGMHMKNNDNNNNNNNNNNNYKKKEKNESLNQSQDVLAGNPLEQWAGQTAAGNAHEQQRQKLQQRVSFEVDPVHR